MSDDDNPETIWLEPICAYDSIDGRLWSVTRPERCDECDLDPVKYRRADLPPTPAEAMRCPEVMALVEAMRKSLKRMCGNGMGDWKEAKMIRSALSALDRQNAMSNPMSLLQNLDGDPLVELTPDGRKRCQAHIGYRRKGGTFPQCTNSAYPGRSFCGKHLDKLHRAARAAMQACDAIHD